MLARRAKARRDQLLARLEAELARIDATRERTNRRKPGKRRDAEATAHTKAECALRDHLTLWRYLRQLESPRLRIDRGAIAAEERLDGSTCCAGSPLLLVLLHRPLEEMAIEPPATLVVNDISMHECRDLDQVTRKGAGRP